ncbi:MAG TPA: MBL fold metallo-hydrolase [Chloroflexota bacterium]|nr:MBL fold metallo-hydrolase [Chloroflexota bacterium]
MTLPTASFVDESRNVATGRPVEALPGIWEVRESLSPVFDTPDCWVSLWLLTDPAGKERPVMIDSGVPRSTATVVLPALKALGFAPTDLAVCVNTHNHHDHTGSNIQLREATSCQIWIHEDDAEGLRRGSTFGEERIESHEADRLLKEGETLRLAGRNYEVVHIPGHSPGSIGLYDRDRTLFFCGDALQAQGTMTQGIAGAGDREAYLSSLEKVGRLEIDHLMAAHPYLPFTDSHVRPAGEVKRYLAECRRFMDEIDGEILAALEAQGGRASAEQLADRICSGRGFEKTCELTAGILRGYLKRLEEAGRLKKEGEIFAAA